MIICQHQTSGADAAVAGSYMYDDDDVKIWRKLYGKTENSVMVYHTVYII